MVCPIFLSFPKNFLEIVRNIKVPETTETIEQMGIINTHDIEVLGNTDKNAFLSHYFR